MTAERRDLVRCATCGAVTRRVEPAHVARPYCGGDHCLAPPLLLPEYGTAARRATARVRRQTEALLRRARGWAPNPDSFAADDVARVEEARGVEVIRHEALT